MQSIISVFMAIIMFLVPTANLPKAEIDTDAWNTNYTCVFVHGLAGWGSYDVQYGLMPYWGMFGGDMIRYFNARGFDCHAASVDPGGSAWDRACELYAQLTGTRVDYGAAHAERCKHARFGKDYTGRALIDAFSAEHKINLFGHSFGGATILMFAELMANGSREEQAAAADASSLFAGGKGDWIYSITALSAPMNGTTAYTLRHEFQDGTTKPTLMQDLTSRMIGIAGGNKNDGRIDEDSAEYDMTIDNALAMLDGIETQAHIYYFSVPCCCTMDDGNGNQVRDPSVKVEPLVLSTIDAMGCYTGVTPGGYVIDDRWKANDGLVNTFSARAPLNAPQQEYDSANVQPGIWNVMPTYRGDHQALMGDLIHINYIRPFYLDLLVMINSL
ncbi:MAG: hypothetical protein IJK64_07130 [Clostridia bacterium]|nr:hypothetical protein [Clostridia bacterium]